MQFNLCPDLYHSSRSLSVVTCIILEWVRGNCIWYWLRRTRRISVQWVLQHPEVTLPATFGDSAISPWHQMSHKKVKASRFDQTQCNLMIHTSETNLSSQQEKMNAEYETPNKLRRACRKLNVTRCYRVHCKTEYDRAQQS